MNNYEGFKKAGKFTLDTGLEVLGELSLKGAATVLKLHSDSAIDVQPSELLDNQLDIFGVFYDHSKVSKVSLVNCINIESFSDSLNVARNSS